MTGVVGETDSNNTVPMASIAADLLSTRYYPSLSTLAVLLVVVLIDILICLYMIAFRIHTMSGHMSGHALNCLVAQLALECLACAFLFVHCKCSCDQILINKTSVYETFSVSHYLQLLFCSFFTLSAIVGLLGKALNMLDEDGKGQDADFAQVDFSGSMYFVMMHPLLLGVIFSDALRGAVWVWWVICMLALIAAAVITKNAQLSLGLSYYCFQTAVVLYCVCHNTRLLRLREDLMRRDQQLALSIQDTNMKHMMANVAHDLKTVSS
ncbi:hypothetical protein EON65_41620 [archaeon]|nr:MAG: hypothetical protein EON65_41620 [archaeon]